MKVILNSRQIEYALEDLASRIISDTPSGSDIAVIGIRSRGEIIAQRLSTQLSAKLGKDIECGTLDITLYRDDLNSHHGGRAQVRTTEIGFDIGGKIIILVDDVLYTGRTIRCALDELIDFGRPKNIQLAVLIDRGHRELPIKAEYVGKNIPTSSEEVVQVRLSETDNTDEVVLEEKSE